ncbi:MAG: family 20 glycosylhydrolase [Armatimonadota bacterium]|nr:family 20 glycosylhydrolase [Armatimonadota bacterium]
MNTSDLLLLPTPKKISLRSGSLKLPRKGYIALRGDVPEMLKLSADKLAKALGGDWRPTASPAAVKTPNPIILECDPSAEHGPEGYTLVVKPGANGCIQITAAAPAGIYYGICTLMQLIRCRGTELPALSIHDWPDFPERGVMLDVSRDKVPTLETLMQLIDMLSEWKINQFQLYTEHTFEYIGHEVVWKKASPITGADILTLDSYCRERFIELVPNQNSFGHMERWLRHKEYRELAEVPSAPFSLCPEDPRSLKLISDLYSQLLPHFSSQYFNVGCDETHDLGKGRSKQACEKLGVGRVYLDFLLKLHGIVTEHGRRMLFWGDIIKNHPELIPELPKDVIALEWGYGADYAFKPNCEKHAAAGIEFWVCPGTSTWNSFVGRAHNAIHNPVRAAKEGLETGATGLLNTDWGDNGHHQFLPVSFLGYMVGAACSWNAGADNTNVDRLSEALNAFAFQDSAGVMGRVAYDLADSYTKIHKKVPNSTMPFWLLIPGRWKPEQLLEGVSPEELDAVIETVKDAVRRMRSAKMKRPDAELIKAEFACGAALVELGCRVGKMHLASWAGKSVSRERKAIAAKLEDTIREYERLWLARNRPGGLIDSKARLERMLELLKA